MWTLILIFLVFVLTKTREFHTLLILFACPEGQGGIDDGYIVSPRWEN